MWADQRKLLEREIGHFELQKIKNRGLKIRVSRGPRHWTKGKSGNFGDPFLSATTSWTLKMCFIIMWADQRKLLEREIGHFELKKNQKSRSQNPSITRNKAKSGNFGDPFLSSTTS